jgi:hypothetical protein
MAGQFCSHCGGQNPAGAAFCQYCGSPMVGAPAAGTPLPSAPLAAAPAAGAPVWPPPPGGATGAPMPPPAPPPRRSRRRVWIVVLVVVILIVAVVGVLAYEASQVVSVSQVNFSSPDNTCGLNGVVYYGFNASLGSTVAVGFDMYGNNTTAGGTSTGPCTVHSVSSASSGFTIATQNTPLVVPANTTLVLWLNITVPGSSYSGALNLIAN